MYQNVLCFTVGRVENVCQRAKGHIRQELIPVSLFLNGMLVHRSIKIGRATGWRFNKLTITTTTTSVLLGGERHCESKWSCPRTERSSTDPSIRRSAH